MISNSAPGTRSNAPRSAARAHLLALRSARLKRRQRDGANSSKIAGVSPETVIHDDHSLEIPSYTMLEQTYIANEKNITDNDELLDNNIVIPVHDRPHHKVASDQPDAEPIIEKRIDSEKVLLTTHETMEDRENDTLSNLQERKGDAKGTEKMVENGMADPLSNLPGSGPGLIWILNNAGILSLEDLAAAEKSDLSNKMGLIGKIIDLDFWIDQAGSLLQN
jgi:predicted flap endonuclease-1-like 5' DNA nuclease